MLENFFSELENSFNALNLLILFLEEYVQGNLDNITAENSHEKLKNSIAIIYCVSLVLSDINKIKKEYYDTLVLNENYDEILS